MNTPHFSLSVLICDPNTRTRKRLAEALTANPFVGSVKAAASVKEAIKIIGEETISAIFIDPLALDLDSCSAFVFDVRHRIPHIVFCLYTEISEAERLEAAFYAGPRARFRHYYKLDKDVEDSVLPKQIQEVVFLCQSDVRVFSEIERLKAQRAFYLDCLAPEELRSNLRRFRKKFGSEERIDRKIAFVMMGFGKAKALGRIFGAVQEALDQFGITAVRADDYDYSEDLRNNVHTYLHACDFGVAIFDSIGKSEFNPNIAYEVGYLYALKKPVCLLKDKDLKTVPSDLLGALYSEFDSREQTTRSIKKALREWMARRALGNSEEDGE